MMKEIKVSEEMIESHVKTITDEFFKHKCPDLYNMYDDINGRGCYGDRALDWVSELIQECASDKHIYKEYFKEYEKVFIETLSEEEKNAVEIVKNLSSDFELFQCDRNNLIVMYYSYFIEEEVIKRNFGKICDWLGEYAKNFFDNCEYMSDEDYDKYKAIYS